MEVASFYTDNTFFLLFCIARGSNISCNIDFFQFDGLNFLSLPPPFFFIPKLRRVNDRINASIYCIGDGFYCVENKRGVHYLDDVVRVVFMFFSCCLGGVDLFLGTRKMCKESLFNECLLREVYMKYTNSLAVFFFLNE